AVQGLEEIFVDAGLEGGPTGILASLKIAKSGVLDDTDGDGAILYDEDGLAMGAFATQDSALRALYDTE
ncbi:MAG: hypothetical protein V4479_02690, partial [Actinomycetota bacterium]